MKTDFLFSNESINQSNVLQNNTYLQSKSNFQMRSDTHARFSISGGLQDHYPPNRFIMRGAREQFFRLPLCVNSSVCKYKQNTRVTLQNNLSADWSSAVAANRIITNALLYCHHLVSLICLFVPRTASFAPLAICNLFRNVESPRRPSCCSRGLRVSRSRLS